MTSEPVLVCARVAERLEGEYQALTASDSYSKCGYSGRPIRMDAYKLHIPFMLRFAIGGCEEYTEGTVHTLPRGPPNPFVDTPGAAFCASGADMATQVQAWFGFIDVAVLVGYLIWLRRLYLGLVAIFFLGRKQRVGCRARLRLVDNFGQTIPFASCEDVPRAISVNSGKLQEH